MGAPTAVVTGGGGFLGRALCARLKAEGCRVIALSRRSYPQLEALGIESRVVDLSRPADQIIPQFAGADVVFHVAAKVEMWGRYADFFAVNVLGTRAVLQACRENRIPALVYTSSPSVVADGGDLCGVDESRPYPARHEAHYPATKALAEREVLAADGQGGMRTLALRPHLIFGPGDVNLVPTIVARARAGRLMRVGAGANRTDVTFIEDCVSAHVCAWRALQANPAACGRAYFISQGEPVNMWDWINEILRRSGLPPVKRGLSAAAARALASGCELLAGLALQREPLLTRFLVSEMCTSHYFDIRAARRELGFSPRYSVREAMDLTFGEG